MIHRQKDEQKILKLMEILRKFVTFQNGHKLTFFLEDIHVPRIGDKFKYFDKSLECSRYKFIYVGDDFSSESCSADEDTLWWQFHHHCALNEMIKKGDSSVVPVTDKRGTKIPRLLDIYRPLDVWKLLKERSLDDISDVGELGDSDVNMRTVDVVRHMFDPASLPTPRSLTPCSITLSYIDNTVLSTLSV